MRKFKRIETTDIIIVIILLMVFMIVGSLWDYPISQALYNKSNPFGIYLAAYGEFPVTAGLLFSGLLLCLGHNFSMLKKMVGIVAVLVGLILMFFIPSTYLDGSMFIPNVIMFIVVVSIFFFTIQLCKNANPDGINYAAVQILIVILLEVLLIQIIKIGWERPRMRLLSVNEVVFFRPWWIIGGEQKEHYLEAIGNYSQFPTFLNSIFSEASDEFKSFPSSHSAGAAVLMQLPLLTTIKHKWYTKKRTFFYIGVLWSGLVALSRIIVGAHFVTDTVMGILITFVMIQITMKLNR